MNEVLNHFLVSHFLLNALSYMVVMNPKYLYGLKSSKDHDATLN
jgi:hypothetical protein